MTYIHNIRFKEEPFAGRNERKEHTLQIDSGNVNIYSLLGKAIDTCLKIK